MMKTCSILFVAALCIVCACAPTEMTPASAKSTVQKVFQAKLPQSAADVHVYSVAVMTLVVQGRFECAEADFRKFLAASAVLPDELEARTNPLAPIQGPDLPWWRPASLQDASGVQCEWDAGADIASCMLAASRSGESGRTVVYFMVVYENKKQSGQRADAKADPNRQRETDEDARQFGPGDDTDAPRLWGEPNAVGADGRANDP